MLQNHSVNRGSRDGMLHVKNRSYSNDVYLCSLVPLYIMLRRFPCFHDFLHGVSHPCIPYDFALVQHIFVSCAYERSYMHAYMRRLLLSLHCALINTITCSRKEGVGTRLVAIRSRESVDSL